MGHATKTQAHSAVFGKVGIFASEEEVVLQSLYLRNPCLFYYTYICLRSLWSLIIRCSLIRFHSPQSTNFLCQVRYISKGNEISGKNITAVKFYFASCFRKCSAAANTYCIHLLVLFFICLSSINV